MNYKLIAFAFVAVLALSAVIVEAQSSRRGTDGEQACIAKPAQGLGIAAITEGVSFIMQGGNGPILMLVISFIIGMLVSHAFWTTF